MNNLPFNVALPVTLGTVSGWLAGLFSHNEAVPALTSIVTVLFTTLLRAYFDRQREEKMRQYLADLAHTLKDKSDAQ